MLVPSEALTNLECSFCHNYLSVFPVYHEEQGNHEKQGNNEEEGTFTCGRCPLITDLNPVRQVAYEKLAQFMKFPCQYEDDGCLESYTPHELAKHENSCRYRPYFCPYLPLGECPWQGRASELLDHYLENHRALVLNNFQLEIDLINSYEENYLFVHERKTFIAYVKCNVARDEFTCGVRYFGPSDEAEGYSYKVTLSSDKKEVYELPVRRIQTGTNGLLDREKTTYIDTSNIKLTLHDPNYVLLNVSVTKAGSDKPAGKIEKKVLMFEEEMLQHIECPVCMQYMVPPIMQCNTGHSICSVCKEEINQCPTCRAPLGDTRNFSLEEFTHFLKYPCRYQEYGCDNSSTSTEIKNHEANCTHGPFQCPIDGCPWKNKFTSLMDHIRAEHEDNYLDMDEVTFIAMPGEREEVTFITNAFEGIFKLYFLYDGTSYFWSMQPVGTDDETCKFKFELDIKNDADGERIFVRKSCSPLTSNCRALDRGNSFVELKCNLLDNVICDNALNYTFRVVKEKS